MLIPAGAQWEWDGVHPLHGCVCVFFLQNDLQWTSYPNTPTVSVGGGGAAFWSLLQDLLQAHDWFGLHGPSRWVSIVTLCPLLSFLGHPSGANISSDSWKLLRPAHAGLHWTQRFWCVSATSVPVPHPELLGSELVNHLLQLMMSGVMQARVTPLWPLSNGMPWAQAFSTSHYLSRK